MAQLMRLGLLKPMAEKWRGESEDVMVQRFARCLECRKIISRSEMFECDTCPPKSNREIWCEICGPQKHRHRRSKPELPKKSVTETAAQEPSIEASQDDHVSEAAPMQDTWDESDPWASRDSVVGQQFNSPSSKEQSLKDRVRDVFELIYGDVLADLEREKTDMEKRRFHLENKQNQFNNILRRFEDDVRALIAGQEQQDTPREYVREYKSYERPMPKIQEEPPIANANMISVPNERQLFVGGLPSRISEQEIVHAFSNYGRVVGVKLLPKIVGKNACAFVAFESEDTVQEILSLPNPLTQLAADRHLQRLYVEAKCSTAMANLSDNCKVRVNNLPFGTRLIEVKEFFENFGKVLGAKLRHRRGSGGNQRACFAYVAFESAETANRVADRGTFLFGKNERPIYVKRATETGSRWEK